MLNTGGVRTNEEQACPQGAVSRLGDTDTHIGRVIVQDLPCPNRCTVRDRHSDRPCHSAGPAVP